MAVNSASEAVLTDEKHSRKTVRIKGNCLYMADTITEVMPMVLLVVISRTQCGANTRYGLIL